MKIPADKVGHFIAGAAISAVVILSGLAIGLGVLPCAVTGACMALLVGIAKEIYDQFHADIHTPDKWDAAATFAGGICASLLVAFFRWGMMAMALFLVTCGLAGCFNSRTEETGEAHGQLNGQPVAIQWQRDSEGNTSITVPPIITAAAGILPSPWGELATGALSLIAGGGLMAARAQKRRADEHKADADEGWAKAVEKADP